MKTRRRYNSTLGKLLFIAPVVIIGILVVYAFVELSTPGTLIVKAQTSNGTPIQVPVTVAGKSGETPWTLTLTQGNYVVNFTTIQWFHPPVSRDASVIPGVTSYAVGVYDPISRVIQVTNSGFNATTVTALHGVTPVNWTNPSNVAVTLEGSPAGAQVLLPGQTYSYIFPDAGTFEFTELSNNGNVTVSVQ